jgi:DNA-binding protein H-NS
MATKKVSPSLESLTAQIASLQAQADALRKKEVAEVIAKVKSAVEHYGLTAEDLGLGKVSSKAAKPTPRAAGKKLLKAVGGKRPVRPAKFKDGQGHTWSGLGKRPEWFKAALTGGRTPEELLA